MTRDNNDNENDKRSRLTGICRDRLITKASFQYKNIAEVQGKNLVEIKKVIELILVRRCYTIIQDRMYA